MKFGRLGEYEREQQTSNQLQPRLGLPSCRITRGAKDTMLIVQPVAVTQPWRNRGVPPHSLCFCPAVPPASWINEEAGDDITTLGQRSQTPINCANLGEENKEFQESQQRMLLAPSGFLGLHLKAVGSPLDSEFVVSVQNHPVVNPSRMGFSSFHLSFQGFHLYTWPSTTKSPVLHFNRTHQIYFK